MISRAELDELYRADDEARAEQAEWLARREAQARPFVRKSDNPAGLIFRTQENEPEPAPPADTAGLDGDLADDSRAIDRLYEEFNRLDESLEVCFAHVEREIIALKAKLDV